MKVKKAIVIVSVGTCRIEALLHTTMKFIQKAEDEFPEYQVYQAFSNPRILHKMKEKKTDFFSIPEIFTRMANEKIEEVVVQPTYLLNGLENDRMLEQIAEYREQFPDIRIGKPLLSANEDYRKTLEAVFSEITLEEEEALVLIGHGTNHVSNLAYRKLEDTAHEMGLANVFVGTMEEPQSKQWITEKLKAYGYRKVLLMPLLYTAGTHMKRDLIEGKDSWMRVLTESGYETAMVEKGLGELEGIQRIFTEHLESQMKEKGAGK